MNISRMWHIIQAGAIYIIWISLILSKNEAYLYLWRWKMKLRYNAFQSITIHEIPLLNSTWTCAIPHCYMWILRLNIYILHVHIWVHIDGYLPYHNAKLQLRCMSINHLMKIRIHGRRRLTQKQAKNLICSRYKMWSISKTENNFYGKKIWDIAVANNPGSNQGKYTFLYAILQLYKSQF